MNNVFTAIQNRDCEAMASLTGSDRQYAGSENVVNITAERLVDALFKQLKQLFPAAEQTNHLITKGTGYTLKTALTVK